MYPKKLSAADKPNIGNSKVRDFSNFSIGSFIADLSQENWNDYVEKGNTDVDRPVSSFYNKYNKIFNKHAPFKTLSNRRKKQLSKPWITKGIRTSIKMKNKLYMSGDDAKYKDYRNKISLLTRLSKKQYFSKFLNGNLTNTKRTWEGINDLLNRKKKQSVTINVLKQPNCNSITNIKSRISNIMNEHFANIRQNLAKELPTPEKYFMEFLDKNN